MTENTAQANRRRIHLTRGDPAPKSIPGLRSDGMTGAEVLEIWRRSGKITADRGPATGEKYTNFQYGKATG